MRTSPPKMTTMIRRLAAICMLFSLLAAPAAANEATDPLLGMLARVPADAIHDDGLVSYVDYRAVESARKGASQPRSSEEWKALQDAGEGSFDLWLAAYGGVVSGSGLPAQAFATAEEWPSVVGTSSTSTASSTSATRLMTDWY